MKSNSAYKIALNMSKGKIWIHFFVHFSYSCTATSLGIRFSALLGVWEIAGEWEKWGILSFVKSAKSEANDYPLCCNETISILFQTF